MVSRGFTHTRGVSKKDDTRLKLQNAKTPQRHVLLGFHILVGCGLGTFKSLLKSLCELEINQTAFTYFRRCRLCLCLCRRSRYRRGCTTIVIVPVGVGVLRNPIATLLLLLLEGCRREREQLYRDDDDDHHHHHRGGGGGGSPSKRALLATCRHHFWRTSPRWKR